MLKSIKFKINLHNNLLWSAFYWYFGSFINYITQNTFSQAALQLYTVSGIHNYIINVNWILLLLLPRIHCKKVLNIFVKWLYKFHWALFQINALKFPKQKKITKFLSLIVKLPVSFHIPNLMHSCGLLRCKKKKKQCSPIEWTHKINFECIFPPYNYDHEMQNFIWLFHSKPFKNWNWISNWIENGLKAFEYLCAKIAVFIFSHSFFFFFIFFFSPSLPS